MSQGDEIWNIAYWFLHEWIALVLLGNCRLIRSLQLSSFLSNTRLVLSFSIWPKTETCGTRIHSRLIWTFSRCITSIQTYFLYAHLKWDWCVHAQLLSDHKVITHTPKSLNLNITYSSTFTVVDHFSVFLKRDWCFHVNMWINQNLITKTPKSFNFQHHK